MPTDTAEPSLIVELSGRLHRARGWMRLAAVALLAIGVLSLLEWADLFWSGSVPARPAIIAALVPSLLYAVLALVMGTWLWGAVKALAAANASGRREAIELVATRLRGFFVAAGVTGGVLLVHLLLLALLTALHETSQPVA